MIDSTSPAAQFQPATAVCLPLSFDVAPLIAEINALGAAAWRAHFNTGYHDGGWGGIALLAAHGNSDSLYAPGDAQAANTVRSTTFGAQCPQLLAAIAQIQCRIRSARALCLAPGSVIREHADEDLVWRDGEARLHIPLQTHDRVEFYVDGQRVQMRPGECWYLDLSRPHRVQNLGPVERVHLVLDCEVNDWLFGQVQVGFSPANPAANETLPQDGATQFLRFRELVFQDAMLLAALRDCSQLDELAVTAVALGRAQALDFSIGDVRAHANRGRREWIEQWIV